MPVLALPSNARVAGDAIIRKSLFDMPVRPCRLFLLGTVLVAGYATFLNLAPLEFGQVVGLISRPFCDVADHHFRFRAAPTLPIPGGVLIVQAVDRIVLKLRTVDEN